MTVKHAMEGKFPALRNQGTSSTGTMQLNKGRRSSAPGRGRRQARRSHDYEAISSNVQRAEGKVNTKSVNARSAVVTA